jgi:membrane protein implicated in regulation of membrane protease activity
MLLDLIFAFLLLVAVALALLALAAAWLALPLSDLLNTALRKIGLAGPSPRTRTIGMHKIGKVSEPFALAHDGRTAVGKVFVKGEIWTAHCDASLARQLARDDEVEIVYDQELTVTVVSKVGNSTERFQ